MSDIEISVIIPLYNAENYIEQCLNALEEQTFKNFEVIIVDDCSKDASYAKVDKLKKCFSFETVLLKNEENKGPGASRNLALDNVRGKWVTFCDSDDYYEPNYLESMRSALLSNKADIAFCNFAYIDSTGKKKNSDNIQNLSDVCLTKSDWIAYSQMSLCRIMINTSMFKNLRMPELYHCEDAAIIPLLVARASHCISIDKVLYNYCLREDSASVKRPDIKVVGEMYEAYMFMMRNRDVSCEDAFEYLGALLILYGSTMVSYKAKLSKHLIKFIVEKYECDWPDWYNNKYIRKLSGKKKWYFKRIQNRNWLLLKLYAELHYLVVHFLAK